jgi:hypothetical protein
MLLPLLRAGGRDPAGGSRRPGGEGRGEPDAAIGRRLAALAAGGAIPIVAAGLALGAAGALPAWWQATVSFTGNYTRLAWARPRLLARTLGVTGLAFLLTTWGGWLLAVAGTALGTGSGRSRRLGAALWIAAATAAASVCAQGKFFPYHWTILWAPLALLGGLGADRLAARLPTRPGRSPSRPPRLAALLPLSLCLAAAVASAATSAPGWNGWRQSLRRMTGSVSPAEHRAVFRVQGMGYDELFAVAEGIRRHTSPGETIYLWGFEPAFYLAAGRPFPGRFPFSYPLIAPWAPARWREEFLQAFAAAGPEWVVVRRGDPIPWVAGVGGDGRARLSRFPELEREIAGAYRSEAALSSRHLETYRRVAPPPGRR